MDGRFIELRIKLLMSLRGLDRQEALAVLGLADVAKKEVAIGEREEEMLRNLQTINYTMTLRCIRRTRSNPNPFGFKLKKK